MNVTQYGPGDEITWGAVYHPNDPRCPEPEDEPDPDDFAEHLINEGARLKALCRAGKSAEVDDALRELHQYIEDLLP